MKAYQTSIGKLQRGNSDPLKGATKSKSPSKLPLLTALILFFFGCLLILYSSPSPAERTTRTEHFLEVEEEEEGPKDEADLAFLIQAYELSVELVPSLLQAIWHPRNTYAIHVDAKASSEKLGSLSSFIRDNSYSNNVFLMPSEPITYMGVTLLINTINAISFLLSKSQSWDYFINLSGMDYPLVPPDELRKILGSQPVLPNKLNFVKPFGDPASISDRVYESRFRTMYVDSSLWLPRTGEGKIDWDAASSLCATGCLRPIAKGIQSHPLLNASHGRFPLLKTEAWVILHRSFAECAVDSPLSRRLQSILVNVICPEEFFFGTLLNMSTEFRTTATFDSFRTVLWGHKDRNISRSSPPDLDSGEIDNINEVLLNSGDLFCRKLKRVSSPLKTFINENMLRNVPAQGERHRGSLEPLPHLQLVRRRVECIAKFRNKYGDNGIRKDYRVCRSSSKGEVEAI